MDSLNLLDIPTAMNNVILHCISSSNLCINWNGSRTQSFHASRGLRQGDPISPYLFVIALERLSHKINDLVTENRWKPLSFGRGNGPLVSHIFFADDIVLFAEANVDQVQVIKDVLDEFCSKSGQKVSLQKSKVFFSKNTKNEDAVNLSNLLGIDQTDNSGIYLGAPLLHQRVSKQSVSFVLDKMKKKLSYWKSKSLSFSGRITLAQACLYSILGYIIQSMAVPASVCDEVEAICRNFIWGSSDTQRKCHRISWEKICKPKDQGGLGFRNMRLLNKSCLAKLAWQLANNPEKLWVKIMKFKYNCGAYGHPSVSHKANSSNTWKSISNIWNLVDNNISWIIRDGNNTRFWRDNWIPGIGKLKVLFADNIPVNKLNFPVTHYASENGWKWDLFAHCVSEDVCDALARVNVPLPSQTDFPSWTLAPDGQFSIKSSYLSLFDDNPAGTSISIFVKV